MHESEDRRITGGYVSRHGEEDADRRKELGVVTQPEPGGQARNQREMRDEQNGDVRARHPHLPIFSRRESGDKGSSSPANDGGFI